jgi:PTS system nitrogen regulatory IIA component
MLSLDCTKSAVLINSKKRIIEYIAQLAKTKLPELSEYDILESLLSREKLGSTGIGNGIALPHGRLHEINQSLAIFVTTKTPVHYDAIDDRPVDIFCALLIPEEQCEAHLSTLSSIAKLLNDKSVCKQIRQAETDEQVYRILMENS